MNPFRDQEKFMKACDQTTEDYNHGQVALYANLIDEEVKEFNEAYKKYDHKEMLDALIDIIVVATGCIHSMGADAEGAWKEVMQTNFNKIDKETGKVRKREDGKVLKPMGWKAPELAQFLKKGNQ